MPKKDTDYEFGNFYSDPVEESSTPPIEETPAVVEAAPAGDNNEVVCTVIQPSKNGVVGILFENCGILVETDVEFAEGDAAIIEFSGVIGTPNFEITSISA